MYKFFVGQKVRILNEFSTISEGIITKRNKIILSNKETPVYRVHNLWFHEHALVPFKEIKYIDKDVI